MKNIYFTCGPSQLYPTVAKHFETALYEEIMSISHRSKKFQEIYYFTQKNLRTLLKIPKSHHIFFLCSSLEAMERIIQNCVFKNCLHFVNGSFSRKFYHFAKILKKRPVKIEVPAGVGFDLEKINIPKNTELICLTHNETSTGVSTPLQYVNLVKQNKKHLIALDIVSSAPYVKVDFSLIDLVFFSVQKGFGLPAGLSVLIISSRAIARSEQLRKKGRSSVGHHNFFSMLEKEKICQTPETPNVLEIYLLGKVCRDMLDVGIAKIRQETEIKAKVIYDYFDNHPKYKPFVKDPIFRSKTTITIDVQDKSDKIIDRLKTKGMIVNSGYGDFKKSQIRIANFPAHTLNQMQNLLSNF